MISYLLAEKAGMPFNAFYPQGQRVAEHKVVDRSLSASGGKRIRFVGRNFDGLIRGNDLFDVDE